MPQSARGSGAGYNRESYGRYLCWLLRMHRKAEREHQRRNDISDKLQSLTASFCHRITLSALPKHLDGLLNPICLAVFRLMRSSTLVGRSTGSSAGLAPLRTLSM